MYYSPQQAEEILEDFHQKIMKQEDLDPKILEALNRNFLDLIESMDEEEE